MVDVILFILLVIISFIIGLVIGSNPKRENKIPFKNKNEYYKKYNQEQDIYI